MSKFTIFTIILSVSVITIFADLLVRDYVQGNGLASVLTAGQNVTKNGEEISPVLGGNSSSELSDNSGDNESAIEIKADAVASTTPTIAQTNPVNSTSSATSTPPVTFATQSRVKAAGFTGTIEEKQFPGKLYQLLDVSTFPVQAINNYMVTENSVAAVAVTEIVLRDEIQAIQLYLLLQNKTKPYIDLTLNETNAYGERSFYINHAKKPNEAFLTVKIKNRIYGFAYVKFYHPELKKFIALLADAI